MADETVNIEIREDGSRVVARNLEAVARQAEVTQASLDLMKNALATIQLSVKGPVSSLQQMRSALAALKAASASMGGMFDKTNIEFTTAAMNRLTAAMNEFAAKAPERVQAAVGRINIAVQALQREMAKASAAAVAPAGGAKGAGPVKQAVQTSMAFMNQPMVLQGQGWQLEGNFKSTATAAQGYTAAVKQASQATGQLNLNLGAASQASFAFMNGMRTQTAPVNKLAAQYSTVGTVWSTNVKQAQQLSFALGAGGGGGWGGGGGGGGGLAGAAGAAGGAAGHAAGGFRSMAGSIFNLQNALRMIAGYLFLNEIREYIDTWIAASNMIRLYTKNADQAATVQRRLFAAAQETRMAFGEVVQLYQRISQAATSLNASQEETISMTRLVGMGLAIQNKGAAEARGALLQLSQMFGMAKIRLQEFNAVSENAPRILLAAAKHVDGAGGSIQKLRLLIEKGKVSSRDFFDAIMKDAPALEAEFAKINPTLSQSFTVLDNALGKFIFDADEGVGASGRLAKGIIGVANNLDILARSIGALTVALGALFVVLKWSALTAGAARFAAAIGGVGKALLLAFAANPIVGLIALVTAAAAAIYLFRDKIILSKKEGISLGDVFRAVFDKIKMWIGEVIGVFKRLWQSVFGGPEATEAQNGLVGAQQKALSSSVPFADKINAAAEKYKVSAAVIAGLIRQESNFDPNAVSVGNAKGLMQFTKGTAQQYGLDTSSNNDERFNPGKAIDAGTHYLADLIKRYDGDVALAITAYNVGEGTVDSILKATGPGAKFEDIKNKLPKNPASGLAEGAIHAPKVLGYASEYEKMMGGPQQASVAEATIEPSKWQQAVDFVLNLLKGFLDGVKTFVNGIIGSFVFMSNAVPVILQLLPDAIAEWLITAMNKGIGIVGDGINAMIKLFNKLTGGVFEMEEIQLPTISDKDVKGQGERLRQGLANALKDAMGKDYVGEAANWYVGKWKALIDELHGLAAGYAKARADAAKTNDAGLGDKPGGEDPRLAKLREDYDKLLNKINPSIHAQKEFTDGLDLLHKVADAGIISVDQFSDSFDMLQRHYEDSADPIGAYLRQLQEEVDINKQFRVDRQASMELMKKELEFKKKGQVMSDAERRYAKELIDQKLFDKQVMTEMEAIYNRIIGSQKKLQVGQVALAKAYHDGWISVRQYRIELAKLRVDAGQGTFADGFLAQLGFLEDKMTNWAARAGGLMADTFNSMIDGISDAVGQAIMQWESFSDLVENLARSILQQLISGFVKLGIQMVVTSAIGDALKKKEVATTTAMNTQIATSAAPAAALENTATFGGASAAAMIGLTAVMALALGMVASKGFSSGGYTGEYGRNDIAGVVHGREFVVNANATARYRALLETLNSTGSIMGYASGGYVGAPTSTTPPARGGLSITVENHTPANFEFQQTGPDQMRIIAREEARGVVHRETSRVVATEIRNPNSRVSKTLGSSTTTSRRR